MDDRPIVLSRLRAPLALLLLGGVILAAAGILAVILGSARNDYVVLVPGALVHFAVVALWANRPLPGRVVPIVLGIAGLATAAAWTMAPVVSRFDPPSALGPFVPYAALAFGASGLLSLLAAVLHRPATS